MLPRVRKKNVFHVTRDARRNVPHNFFLNVNININSKQFICITKIIRKVIKKIKYI